MISSAKSRAEALHIDSSFVEPNAWIVDMENCQRLNLHLAVDGQSERCSLIPAARLLRQLSTAITSNVATTPPSLPMLRARATVLTSFMNEDRTSLMNFRRFAVPDEPDYLMCHVYGGDGNMCHPSQNYSLLLDGYQCFKCLVPHLRSDCRNSIP